MNMDKKNGPGLGGVGAYAGAEIYRNERSIFARREISNPYLANYEKMLLAKFLVQGFCDPMEFYDTRHHSIFQNLKCFLENHAKPFHSSNCLLRYIEGSEGLDICGGENFVLAIFRGINP